MKYLFVLLLNFSIVAALMHPVRRINRVRTVGVRGGATTAKSEKSQSGLGWDSHKAIDAIPEVLGRAIDGNDSMRRKFEILCRNAQVMMINFRFLFPYDIIN